MTGQSVCQSSSNQNARLPTVQRRRFQGQGRMHYASPFATAAADSMDEGRISALQDIANKLRIHSINATNASNSG